MITKGLEMSDRLCVMLPKNTLVSELVLLFHEIAREER
jgi:hypothetical protein